MHDDLRFVRRCVRGDRQAQDELVERYSRLIYSYIHQALKIKGSGFYGQENIKDIFQGVFLFLIQNDFRKLRTYKARNGCSLAGWLKRVTINFTISYLRGMTGGVVCLDTESDEGLSLKDILTDDSADIRDLLCDKEKIARLKECIKRLNSEDKYFLELHLNQGLSLEELRGVLKINRGAADMRRARLIDRLRACFQEKGLPYKS